MSIVGWTRHHAFHFQEGKRGSILTHTKRIMYLQIMLTSRKEHNGSYERDNRRTFRLGAVAHTCNPSTLGGPRPVDHLPWVWDQHDQHGETPPLLKMQKLAKCGWRVPVIPATWEADAWTWEAEVAVSWDRTTALQLSWAAHILKLKHYWED